MAKNELSFFGSDWYLLRPVKFLVPAPTSLSCTLYKEHMTLGTNWPCLTNVQRNSWSGDMPLTNNIELWHGWDPHVPHRNHLHRWFGIGDPAPSCIRSLFQASTFSMRGASGHNWPPIPNWERSFLRSEQLNSFQKSLPTKTTGKATEQTSSIAENKKEMLEELPRQSPSLLSKCPTSTGWQISSKKKQICSRNLRWEESPIRTRSRKAPKESRQQHHLLLKNKEPQERLPLLLTLCPHHCPPLMAVMWKVGQHFLLSKLEPNQYGWQSRLCETLSQTLQKHSFQKTYQNKFSTS